MVSSSSDIANDIVRNKSYPIDYWNLQAYMHLQRIADVIGRARIQSSFGLSSELLQAISLSKNKYNSQNNYMDLYQKIVNYYTEERKSFEQESLVLLSKVFFEADAVGVEALKVLEEINKRANLVNETEGTIKFHKELLEKYTFEKGAVVSNPDSTMEELGSIMGVGFDPVAKGRIPYKYPFYVNRSDGRQVPISLGCPVQHKNLYRTCNVHPIFESYVDSNLTSSKDSDYLDHLDYLYINLQRHHDGAMPQVKSEYLRSEELHKVLNAKPGAAAVSLPAHSTFFNQGINTHKHTADSSVETLENMLTAIVDAIAKGDDDFVIPDKVLILMYKKMKGTDLPYGFDLRSHENIKELVLSSYKEAVIMNTGQDYQDISKKFVDANTRAAVMSYFVKATLTHQILNATNPKRYNITCKDAIDRAGTHNILLSIHRKILAGEKIHINEVKRCLNGLAMAYKHRPINHQGTVFFNTFEKLYYSMSEEEQKRIFPADDTGNPWPAKWIDESSPIKPTICLQARGEVLNKIEPNTIIDKINRKLGKPYKGTLGDYEVDCTKDLIRVHLKSGTKISELYGDSYLKFMREVSASAGIPDIGKYEIASAHKAPTVASQIRTFSPPAELLGGCEDREVYESTLRSKKVTPRTTTNEAYASATLPDTSIDDIKSKIAGTDSGISFVRRDTEAGEIKEEVLVNSRSVLMMSQKQSGNAPVKLSTVETNPVDDDIKLFAECIISSNCKKPVIKTGNVIDVIKVLQYLKERDFECKPVIAEHILNKAGARQLAILNSLSSEPIKEPLGASLSATHRTIPSRD
jgi:hypothetical protein